MSERREKDEKEERRRYPSLFWPVILITAGVLFLLSNLGYIHINFWELWRLWPVLIILVGLDILFGRRSALGSLIVLIITIIIIAGVVWIAATGAVPFVAGSQGGGTTMNISQPLGGAERASLDVSFASGQLTIDALTDSNSLVEGTLSLASQRQPTWEATGTNGQVTMKLGYPPGQGPTNLGLSRQDNWQLHLSPKVGFDLAANLAAGDSRLDLTGLDVRTLHVNTAAGQTTVILPAEGDLKVTISGAVGSVVLEVPDSMAVHLRANRGLAPLSVSSRYHRIGDVYEAGDWSATGSRADIQIDAAIGAVTVREP